jgi:hypothetical protein
MITSTALFVAVLALATPSAASSGASGLDDQAPGVALEPESITTVPSAETAGWTPLQVLDGKRGRDALRIQTTGDGTSVASWRAYTEGCADGFWASVRRPGEDAWEAPFLMGGADPDVSSVAVGGRGWAFAAYDTCHSELFVHRLLADGWGPRLAVPVPADFDGLFRTAINSRGDLLIGYYRDGDVLGGAVKPRGGPWETLPPLPIEDFEFPLSIDIDSDGQVTYAIHNADQGLHLLAATFATLVAGEWVSQRIEPPPGEHFEVYGARSDGRGSVALLAKTTNDAAGRSEILSYVRPRGGAELGPPELVAEGVDIVCCASGTMTRSGRMIETWSEGLEPDAVPWMASRGPRTGRWTSPKPIGPPSARGIPISDMHADGTVISRLRLRDGVEDEVYLCTGVRDCTSVGFPAHVGNTYVADFEAGPGRSATLAIAQERCGEECMLSNVRVSYLAPVVAEEARAGTE